MKIWLASAAAFLCLIAGTVLFAQMGPGPMWHGSGGWGPDGSYNRMYDPKMVETINGEVVGLSRLTPHRGMSAGMLIDVKTDSGTIAVHLGPSWYLEYQDVKIQPKDKVEVKGARVAFAGKPAIIAAEVKKGGETLILRDDKGFPAWSGWRRLN